MDFWQWILGYFVLEWMENDKESDENERYNILDDT